MRQTKTRQEVLDFLQKNHSAFTPYELGEKLSINTVTIYRVLDFLKEQKLVHHIPALAKWSACQCLAHARIVEKNNLYLFLYVTYFYYSWLIFDIISRYRFVFLSKY